MTQVEIVFVDGRFISLLFKMQQRHERINTNVLTFNISYYIYVNIFFK